MGKGKKCVEGAFSVASHFRVLSFKTKQPKRESGFLPVIGLARRKEHGPEVQLQTLLRPKSCLLWGEDYILPCPPGGHRRERKGRREEGREGGKEGRGEEAEEEIDLSNTEVTYQIGKNYGDR